MPDAPLVSCLCVTRGKPQKLRRAIACFLAQTHIHKELVLVFEDDDPATQQVVEEFSASRGGLVVGVKVPSRPKLTLGALRNLAVRRASGAYFCQWDDDDWFHNQRIGSQLRSVITQQRKACLLSNWIVYDELERQAYLSFTHLWEGSLLCRKDVVTPKLRYPAISRQEDSAFTDLLVRHGPVSALDDAALYIYTAHTSNTWPRQHFLELFRLSTRLSAEASQLIGDILTGRYSVDAASMLLRGARFHSELKLSRQPVA